MFYFLYGRARFRRTVMPLCQCLLTTQFVTLFPSAEFITTWPIFRDDIAKITCAGHEAV